MSMHELRAGQISGLSRFRHFARGPKSLAAREGRGESAAQQFLKRSRERPMDFTMSTKQKEWLGRVQAFMNKHVRPAVPVYGKQDAEGPRWKVIPIIEEVLMVSRGASCTAMTRKPKISRGSRNFTLDELLADT